MFLLGHPGVYCPKKENALLISAPSWTMLQTSSIHLSSRKPTQKEKKAEVVVGEIAFSEVQ